MRHLTARVTAVLLLVGASVVGLATGAPAAGWSVVASPNPTGSTGAHLNGVSCVNASSCFAVGYYSTASSPARALIERWNGTKWATVAAPNPTGSVEVYLNGVSCVSASSCFAVGYFTTGSSTGHVLTERWNGTKWFAVGAPNPSGATGAYFDAVSCVSASTCAAVGYSYNSTATHTLAARWSGTRWSVVATPNPNGDDPDLVGVSCTSATNCLAVGFYTTPGFSDATLAERWNGTKWSLLGSVNPKNSDSYLNGVSCASATSCMAVGVSYGATGPGGTLVERWNGSSWSNVASPNPAGSGDAYLNGVRCASATNCVAVGAYAAASDSTLVQRWNGSSWAVVASPNPAGSTGSYLNAVSCAPATSCKAVGDWHGSAPSRTLVERSG